VAANVDGVLSLKDASDVEKILLDKDGILIKSGKLTIKNDSNQTVVDAKGIVSNSNNFILTNVNGAPGQSIASTSATDITGSSVNIVVDRATNFLFLLSTESYLVESVGNTGNGEMGLNITGAYPRCVIRMRTQEVNLETRTNFYVTSLAAGTHTVKLQARLSHIYAGSPSMTLESFSWTYIKLGT